MLVAAAAAAAAAALAPPSSLRFSPQTAARFISFYSATNRNPRIITLSTFKTLTTPPPHLFPPSFQYYSNTIIPHHLSRPRTDIYVPNRRPFCTVASGALSSSGEAIENQVEDPKLLEKTNNAKTGRTEKVREFRKRLRIVDIKGGPDEGLDLLGQKVVVKGWVNDGSCLSNMQCVTNSDAEGYDQVESGFISTGASVWVEGTVVSSQGSKQKIELKVAKVITVGRSDPSFPIQKKRVSREFLRTKAHLRPRTNTFGAVARVRNALAYATHKFFQENGFIWVSSPIITASDCEGAGEQFCVTTLISSIEDGIKSATDPIPKTEDGLIDWSKDFFGKPAFLTVSGQLNAETYASALSDVYTFGPTFRAENSNTSRHLAEFWMIEPELAFADLNDDMACATAYLQYVVRYVLENCKEDMDFFNTWIEKGIIDRLSDVAEKDFVQLTYTDAIELLLRAKKKFEFPVKWGCDLQSEHERYITEDAFSGSPVIIRDYPKARLEIKAFYMRQNDDGKTVAAMDLLVPRIGELIGGSQREERLDHLEVRLDELKLNKESYWWYLDLRRFGSVPHAGFGLGFERLVQFATGIENIRDAIPFPRTPGSAEF
ncbi:Aspartyl/Asparaginyl-tRNA synthetase [Macleaya cordata]|uniref:asparagine--tRNA ligase n=1 Tax=Macleaya cordata TaxID=56857 RepID=A0A200PY63_MACCD|nr:Aspartyl/Asparaginyl-tRNA synthetase [Macleaya cordata]